MTPQTATMTPATPAVARLARFALVALLTLGACLFAPREAAAGYFELAAGFSYNKSNYGDGSFEWTRRWTASVGYHISDRSEFEFAFQDMVNRTSLVGYQDTTFHDQTFSVNWVQSLFGRDAFFDPYFKLGLGQLDHIATGTYYMLGGASADSEDASLTEIVGVGARIGFTKRLGLRIEADTYITNWHLSTWQDNVYFTAGLSVYF